MILAVDVHYAGDVWARVAGVVFREWGDRSAAHEAVAVVEGIEPYVPGAFYRRELPCIRALLGTLDERPNIVVVDGYVDVGPGRPGLGRHLFDAMTLGGSVVVVGVAKTAFAGAPAVEVRRGRSEKPLFVTSAGLDPAAAAREVARMAGRHRIPTLLQRVDQLARGSEARGR